MRIVAVRILTLLWLGLFIGLSSLLPAQAFTLLPPTESLAGLTPGVSTMADAVRLHGAFDITVPGIVEQYAGGNPATDQHRWSLGPSLGKPGLLVETSRRSKLIEVVMIDTYPGLSTKSGLTSLVSDGRAIELYGLPDYAFEFSGDDCWFREMYYIDQGLLLMLNQVPGRPNWTITKVILTYPTYLRNAVSLRERYALSGCGVVDDITSTYRVWARMATQPD